MRRTQLSFDGEVLRRAQQRAAERGISLAEYVRRLVEADLSGPQRESDPSAVFNLGSCEGSDIAREKDAMLAKAFQGLPPVRHYPEAG